MVAKNKENTTKPSQLPAAHGDGKVDAMPLVPHKLCYLALLLIALCVGAMMPAVDAWVDVHQIGTYLTGLAVPLLCLACAMALLRPSNHRLRHARERLNHLLQGLFFLSIAWVVIRLFNHLTMRLTADIGYVDSALAKADRLLGASWIAYFEWVESNAFPYSILDWSYTSLSLLSVLTYMILACCCEQRRCRFFLEAFFFTAVICTTLGMWFPAQGATYFHLAPVPDSPDIRSLPGLWFLDSLAAVRSGDTILLNIGNLPGLVTFPSFHAAAGVLIVTVFWRSRLFLPALLYSCSVIAATPIFGGHYIVDLLAGSMVAALTVWVLVKQRRFKGLFGTPPWTARLRRPPAVPAGAALGRIDETRGTAPGR